MFTKIWRHRTVRMALVIISVFVTAEVEAQPFGGRGGHGFGGGQKGRAGEGLFRNGAANGSGWRANRQPTQENGQFSPQQFQSRKQTGDAASQTSRQNTAKDLQTRQQAGDAANREDWQSHANQDREDRQDYRTNTREDWQDYDESHGGYYGGYYRGYGYPAYPAGGVAAGMAIGSTMTAAAFNQQKASCTTLIVNGMTYYQCGSTWYQPSSQGGNVTYIVVSPPK